MTKTKKTEAAAIQNRIVSDGMVLVRAKGHMYECEKLQLPGALFEVDEERAAALGPLVEIVKES